jgi:hypothetical protein
MWNFLNDKTVNLLFQSKVIGLDETSKHELIFQIHNPWNHKFGFN